MGDATIDVGWFAAGTAAWALIAARAAGVCFTAPVLAAPGLGWRFRLALALLLGAWMTPLAAPRVSVAPSPSFGLAWLVAAELLVGGAMGMAASLVVAGARQAGELISAQAGLSTASLFDPESGEESTALGHLYGWIALAAFLGLDGPLVLTDALLRSFEAIPAGRSAFGAGLVQDAFAQAAEALKLAVRAAAPAAVALIAAGAALGWLGRLAPSVPLMALSLPIRAALGVLLVMAGLVALAACLEGSWVAWAGGRL